VYVHRAAPPPTTGVRTKLIAVLTVGQTFLDPVRNIGLEFTSLSTATDTGVVTLITAPVITSNPASKGTVGVAVALTFTVAATGHLLT
jgi:hypothetical protein